VMYANGSAQTPLTNHPGFDGQPTWAGDNQRLAFVSRRSGQPAIYVMSDNGGELTALTASSLSMATPAWQPLPPAPFVDMLVYAASNNGLSDLYTIGVNGANQQKLTHDPGLDNTMPAWSPDGSRIAFASTPNGNYDIFVLALAPTQSRADATEPAELVLEVVNLTNDPAKDMRPARSPDGSQIAFASNRGGDFDIFVVNADGSGRLQNLTQTPANEFNPAWSPQGDLLAFRSDQDERHQIYVVQADGSGLRRLMFTEADDDQPAWSPDGRRIAFISNRALGSDGRRSRQPSPSYALYLFDLETRITELIAGDGGVDIRYPSWKPRP